MSIWLTDERRGAWVLDGAAGAAWPVECSLSCPYCPCAACGWLLCACRAQRDVSCVSCETLREVGRIPAMPALCALRVSPCGRYIYQLSAEADALHTRLLSTGELLYACPVGVFPRDLRLHPNGRLLLTAGGASGEAALWSAPTLRPAAQAQLPGAVCAADFWREGLVIVCAMEEGDIHTAVYTLSAFTAAPRELCRLPGPPGGLCVCPDGVTALLGAQDGVHKLSLHTGQSLWRLPACPLCGLICCKGAWTLCSDLPDGRVLLLPHEQPWRALTLWAGEGSQACFA